MVKNLRLKTMIILAIRSVTNGATAVLIAVVFVMSEIMVTPDG